MIIISSRAAALIICVMVALVLYVAYLSYRINTLESYVDDIVCIVEMLAKHADDESAVLKDIKLILTSLSSSVRKASHEIEKVLRKYEN